jgi:4-aminobutyrate aminotransferase
VVLKGLTTESTESTEIFKKTLSLFVVSARHGEKGNHDQPTLSRYFPSHGSRVEPHFQLCCRPCRRAYIYTDDGKKLLDFTSGIGVTNTGHCHPKVVEAIREQAGSFLHAQANIVIHKPMLQLIEELRKIVPPSIDSFFFANSGAEAVENAVKIAKAATGRPNVIVFNGSFHGRTHVTMALTTSKTGYRTGFAPLPSGIYVSPFPYAFHLKMTEEQASQYALEQLEYLLASQTAPKDTAAILIESVLGEGGYILPPASFMKGLREICDKHGIMLIFDEVQSGFGRTGKWFALGTFWRCARYHHRCKGHCLGYAALGCVHPHGHYEETRCRFHRRDVWRECIACAAGVATIRAMRDEKMLENAAEKGIQLMTGLRKLQEEYPQIGDVRGKGLMVGTEFIVDGSGESQAAGQGSHPQSGREGHAPALLRNV